VRGVVAAGNPHTAEAAASVLRQGGNAVDALVAGALASFVAEPLLASAGGSGMMTLALPGQEPVVVDFFSAMPGLDRPADAPPMDFEAIEIDFGAASQVFHIGRASAAPPLALPGLAAAAKKHGTLDLETLTAPAIELALRGCPLTEEAAEVFRLLWPINLRTEECQGSYSDTDQPPHPGSRRAMPGMARLLQRFAEHGGPPPELQEALLEHFGPSAGGAITEADLARAEPRFVAPRTLRIGEWEVLASPRLGGKLLGVIAGSLAEGFIHRDEAEEVARHAEACRAGTRAKSDERAFGSTTHLSVIDAHGGAAAATLTNGEGSGHVLPGTQVQLNNFCGEEDLHPGGFFAHEPGSELPSMIAPTIVRGPGDAVLALGSGGANRIRSVVSQVLYRVCILGQPLDAAVRAPRVHAEESSVWLEMEDRHDRAAIIETLQDRFEHVYSFPFRAFFFGGVHAVHARDGEVIGAGDPRRGGAVVRA
jgi:gamma-glutamyltranspeptidase/glutathione hydrolase